MWSEKSDFELSVAVGDKLGLWSNYGGNPLHFDESNVSPGWPAINSTPGFKFNINNWADMGPIINKHGILTLKDEDSWVACYEYNLSLGWDLNAKGDCKFIFDDSQLRAAAICYLES